MMSDFRSHRILVVAHSIASPQPLAAGVTHDRGAAASHAVIDWAHLNGFGVYQLPVAESAFAPLSFENAQSFVSAESRRAHRETLAFVAGQRRLQIENGYEIVGAVFRDGEVGDPRERIWAEDFLTAAHRARVDLPRLWSLPQEDAVAFDPDDPLFAYLAVSA